MQSSTAYSHADRAEMRAVAKSLFSQADEIVRRAESAGRAASPVVKARTSALIERSHALMAQADGGADDACYDRSALFRLISYTVQAKGSLAAAAMAARASGDVEVAALAKAATAAATSGSAGWAGALVAPALGAFVPLLRPRSALFALAPELMPLHGEVNFPRVTTSSASGFVQEGMPIPVRSRVLELLGLVPYKAAGAVVCTLELLKRADAFAEEFVLGTMADDIAQGVDAVFLSNAAAVANVSPAGLFHSSNAATAITATSGGTAQACATDLALLIAAGANMIAPRLLIHPGAVAAAGALANSNTFANIQALIAGRIGRVQVVEAGNMPAVDTLALVDSEGLIAAGGNDFALTTSTDASMHMETSPVADIGDSTTPVRSLFQTESAAAVVSLPVTWRMKRTAQVQWISGATWC